MKNKTKTKKESNNKVEILTTLGALLSQEETFFWSRYNSKDLTNNPSIKRESVFSIFWYSIVTPNQ